MAVTSTAGEGAKFYADDPLIHEPPPRAVASAAVRKLSDYYDGLWHTLATPGQRQTRGAGIPARGVNTLGDPMEGAWWERRHYWRPMSLEELMKGPNLDRPPAMDGKWTVAAAKTEGITPGFVILDRNKQLFFIKFDPPSNPELATGADQIAIRIFHALGYHVPQNHIVHFRPEMLEVGPAVQVEDRLGRKHAMTSRDLTEILMRVSPGADGRYRATASLGLPGKSIGPYRYFGTRADDPNDTVPHEHRRDLRAMRAAAAFIGHDDSRSINTLDVLTDGPSGQHVKHYQLDFGSTLGSASDKVNSARSGGEYLFGWRPAFAQLITLGLAVPSWARATYPGLPAVGRFESAKFDPETWVPEYPNPAFLNRLPDDEFWMAKQVANLRDRELRAIVSAAEYSDRRAADWILKCLIERRDKIARAAFAKVLPLDRFEARDGRLEWVDLAAEYGFAAPLAIQIQWAAFDNDREAASDLPGRTSAALPETADGTYLLATLRSDARPSQAVRVYVRRRDGRSEVVGIERIWRRPQ
jgi:hypothetical protein